MPSKALRLFLISALFLMMTILAAACWEQLHLGESRIPLAIMITGTFGISLSGLIIGFGERKNLATILALIGHFIVVGFFVIMVVYSTTL